jgi:ABC-type lipoprotein export system ATPase subunit
LLVSDYKIASLKINKFNFPIFNDLTLTNIDFAYADTFKRVEVFNNLNITFPAGLNFIWGGNGCGKSTLLKLIEGSLNPDNGIISYRKANITRLPKNKRNTFFIPQQPYQSLSTSSSVIENVIATKKFSVVSMFKLARTDKKFKYYQIETTQLAGNLSGGQAQWLNLELCKIGDNSIILADEPTSGLDLSNFNLFLEFIQKQSLSGKTIIVVTHDTRFKNIKANHINLNS